jgi:N-terminal C2 in EEIG1 and EHBP1 proteins
MDRQNMLQECLIQFEVIQDYNSTARGEKITLGHVSLNLSEYVEVQDQDGEDAITRRYLMQESKINSTLKIGIGMKQLDGERNFIAPALKTAPVFGGITGIMDFEQTEEDMGRASRPL